MVERDACGPGSGMAPGQADGEDGGSWMAGDVAGDAGGGESVAHDPDADDAAVVADLDDALGGGDSGVADLYELRLTALLHQLVRRRGHKGAARELGVNPRTVAASVKQGDVPAGAGGFGADAGGPGRRGPGPAGGRNGGGEGRGCRGQ